MTHDIETAPCWFCQTVTSFVCVIVMRDIRIAYPCCEDETCMDGFRLTIDDALIAKRAAMEEALEALKNER